MQWKIELNRIFQLSLQRGLEMSKIGAVGNSSIFRFVLEILRFVWYVNYHADDVTLYNDLLKKHNYLLEYFSKSLEILHLHVCSIPDESSEWC